MLTEDLDFVADALLALCEQDRTAPFLSEELLKKKQSRDSSREPIWRQLTFRARDYLIQIECRDVVEIAALTDRQAAVLDLRLDGWTFDEMGRLFGCSKQGMQRVFVQTLKKLSRAQSVYPYAGIAEAYREDAARGLTRVRRR